MKRINYFLSIWWTKFKSNIPIPKIFPISTFLQRSNIKFRHLYGYLVGTNGAKTIDVLDNGNHLLVLNRDSALGNKGTHLEIPLDKVIFKNVRRNGEWELNESSFLAEGLISFTKSDTKLTALVDIGANTGLISLQAMNLAQTSNDIHLFEPIPRHIWALRRNINKLEKTNRIKIHEYALSDKNSQVPIYTSSLNRGASSILSSVFEKSRESEKSEDLFETTIIRTVNAADVFRDEMERYDKIVLKSDTEGLDALILSRIPSNIWSKIDRVIIEIMSLPGISLYDVNTTLVHLGEFSGLGWTKTSVGELTIGDIREFWMSGKREIRNLFAIR